MSAFAQRQRPSYAPPSIGEVLRSPGKPLDAPVRARFESRFQHDFSRVRVHDDAPAMHSAAEIGARAWTFGNDIALGRGTNEAVLDHELQHVVQQHGLHAPATPEVAENDAAQPREQQVQRSLLSGFLDVVLFIPRLFGLETFPIEDLQEYLAGLKKRKGPQKSLFSDNMARACVSREKELGPYDTETKVFLIQDMLHGWTTFLDERSINMLLRRSNDREQIVAAVGRDWLWSNFSGENRRAVEAITLTDADFANTALLERLRKLSPKDLQTYIANAVDPKVQAQLQRIVQLQGITTPVPVTATIEPVTGAATFQLNGSDVRVLPDENSNDENLRDHAVTGITFVQSELSHTVDTATNIVNSFTVTPPRTTVVIQTLWGPGFGPNEAAGYGRGTTPEDKFAGATTARFHESQHGTDLLAFVKDHPVPQFNGSTGVPLDELLRQWTAFNDARRQYLNDAQLFSAQETDCAGPTKITPETLTKFGMPVTLCQRRP